MCIVARETGSAGYGRGVSVGARVASQQSDAGVDQTVEARASSRSWAASNNNWERTQIRKPFKRGQVNSPKIADEMLAEESRKHVKTESHLSEAAEQ